MVDRQGIPLAIGLSAANRPDDGLLAALVDTVEPIRRPRGRPRKRPAKLHADKGYDYAHCRATLRRRGITPRIARKDVESKTRLGRHRWVAERTLAWLNQFKRLPIRYERRDDIHQAFLDIGCILICLRFLLQRR
jgi:IS5 family transposase